MNREALREAARMGHDSQRVLIATADCGGLPHVAVAMEIRHAVDDLVQVQAWFCPGTLENLVVNPWVSLVAWNTARDQGYQMIGRFETMQELSVLNEAPALGERVYPSPQVKWQITVRVIKILGFARGSHTDLDM